MKNCGSDLSSKPKRTIKNIPIVSVVIPSYQSALHIRQCLNAISSQRTGLSHEIIVVDSSHDGTDQIVIKEFPEIILIHFDERLSVGAARNAGVENARGEVVLFLDTDCVPQPDWIDRMYSAIYEFDADGVGGSIANGTPGSISGSIGFYLEFFRFLGFEGKAQSTTFFVGGNSGFKKEIFSALPTYHRYEEDSVGEDFIFNWELEKKGKLLLFLPSVGVTHLNKTGLRKVLRYQYTLGKGAYNYRSHVSPRIIRFFERLPILSFLIPIAVMPWLGSIILRRNGIWEFFKFLILLPLLYGANNVWAMGFYRELTNHKSKKATASGNGKVAVRTGKLQV